MTTACEVSVMRELINIAKKDNKLDKSEYWFNKLFLEMDYYLIWYISTKLYIYIYIYKIYILINL